jgi:hypothetical protein
VRVERRHEVGRGGGEPLGADEIAGVAKGAERGIDPSRRPERLARLREGDRVAQRRLVLAAVQELLNDRGGGFDGEAAPPGPGPRRIRPRDGIERGERRAGEKQGLGLGIVPD